MGRLLRSRFPAWLLLTGLSMAGIGFLATFLLALVESRSAQESPHLTLLTWMVFPALAYTGIFLAAAGALWKWQRRNHLRRTAPEGQPFSSRRDLHLALYASVGLGLFLVMVTPIISYRAYKFSESTAFCGGVCHAVMAPEEITHKISPHAQVSCSDCHVGETVAGYVEAKLFGVKELYSLLTCSYPRPIATPIQAMQPVRENCMGCHWEGKFWGKVHRDYSHFLSEEDNPVWTVRMNVKVGGMYRYGESGEGIHWHMKIGPKVYYAASDRQLQKIPWVKLVREDGSEVVYRSTEEPVSDEELASLEIREMVCVDCHNRPAHQFQAPLFLVDEALARDLISPSLPNIKTQSVALLSDPEYQEKEAALAAIREGLLEYYRSEYPQVYQERLPELEQAAQVLQTLYRQNFFPEMKADWRAYPDNIGHFVWDGCFRCHSGQHASEDGRTISNDCSLCHDIVAQGPPGEVESDPNGLPFRHPVDFGVPAEEMGKCTACHGAASAGVTD